MSPSPRTATAAFSGIHSLPYELKYRIAEFLDPRRYYQYGNTRNALVCLAQTSRQWQAVATPLIYRWLRIAKLSSDRRPALLNALAENSQALAHVKRICLPLIRCPPTLHSAGTCVCESHADWDIEQDSVPEDIVVGQIVRGCQSAKSFHFRARSSLIIESTYIPAYTIQALLSLHSLTELFFINVQGLRHLRILAQLIRGLPQIEAVRVVDEHDWWDGQDEVWHPFATKNLMTALAGSARLKNLRLKGPYMPADFAGVDGLVWGSKLSFLHLDTLDGSHIPGPRVLSSFLGAGVELLSLHLDITCLKMGLADLEHKNFGHLRTLSVARYDDNDDQGIAPLQWADMTVFEGAPLSKINIDGEGATATATQIIEDGRYSLLKKLNVKESYAHPAILRSLMQVSKGRPLVNVTWNGADIQEVDEEDYMSDQSDSDNDDDNGSEISVGGQEEQYMVG